MSNVTVESVESNETINETESQKEFRNELSKVVDTIVGLLNENVENVGSSQKRLAMLLAREFIAVNDANRGVERVRLIVSRVKEMYEKDEWKQRKSVISMIVRVLSLSGTIVVMDWVQGKFDKYPIQGTYRALVSKYDAKGNRKVTVREDEKIFKYFRSMSRKHGAEIVIQAYQRFMDGVDHSSNNETDKVIASIDPFDGLGTR